MNDFKIKLDLFTNEVLHYSIIDKNELEMFRIYF